MPEIKWIGGQPLEVTAADEMLRPEGCHNRVAVDSR